MKHKKPLQLSLNVHLNDDATLDNYFTPCVGGNALALHAVRELVANNPSERFVYLWGAEGVGRSHLLQAACNAASASGLLCQYFPLDELTTFDAELLFENLEQINLICLDNLQHVLGQQHWDHALFHFYNRLRDKPHCRLLVSANCAPRDLASSLPDLVSRMAWGVAFHLSQLSDTEKILALKLRANTRGIELSDEVLTFILNHAPRAMNELFECLERIDKASLVEKRRVTIPFIKDALGW